LGKKHYPFLLALPGRDVAGHFRQHISLAAAMEDSEISQAKMQVQGQMAAQYIQEVMQVRAVGPPLQQST
jgi:hypothetical protein